MPAKTENKNYGEEAEFNKDRCSSCGKPIVWAADHCGRPVPLDPAAAVYIVGEDEEGTIKARRPRPFFAAVGKPKLLAAVSHFATCPNAGQHSRRS